MSDDLIKRSDAIEAVWKPQVKPNELIFDALKTAIESEINNVSSADRPQGCWFYSWSIFSKGYECTNCHKKAIAEYDYCPNCGADMRIKKDK